MPKMRGSWCLFLTVIPLNWTKRRTIGKGILADPFMGSGSTVAAAEYVGLHSIGMERDEKFFAMAEKGVPALARIEVDDDAEREEITEGQLTLLEDVPLNSGKSNLPPSSRSRFASHLP